jgi:hypothetical protein
LRSPDRKTVIEPEGCVAAECYEGDEGRRPPFQPDELHFISNAKRGDTETGILNVTFRDDRVVIIDALVDQPGPPPFECIWNAELGWCSDFPGSNEKCNK